LSVPVGAESPAAITLPSRPASAAPFFRGAGADVRTMKTTPTPTKFPRLHRDGTVSFFSYFKQEWVPRTFHVPAEELEAMTPYDRRRVEKHLGYA